MLEVLQQCVAADPWELSLTDRLDGLAALERVTAWLEGVNGLAGRRRHPAAGRAAVG